MFMLYMMSFTMFLHFSWFHVTKNTFMVEVVAWFWFLSVTFILQSTQNSINDKRDGSINLCDDIELLMLDVSKVNVFW